MPQTIINNPNDPTASAWMNKIRHANKYFHDWSQKFKCNEMEEYYYGFQWKDGSTAVKYDRYTINYVFSTIEIKKPSLLFQEVLFRIKPKPAAGDKDFEGAARRASVKEDVVNTIISDPEQEFDEEFEMIVVDAFFRFGIMEVGYSANWAENPNAGLPILDSDSNALVDSQDPDDVLKEPEKIPQNEKVYFKRIKPWRFRVGGVDGHNFKRTNWVGYYDFWRIQDIKANKAFKNIDDLDLNGLSSEGFPGDYEEDGHTSEQSEMFRNAEMVKVWTVYDLRAKRKIMILDSQCITLLEKDYDFFPLVELKFSNKLRGWYPLPPVFNWKSPQDEINEAREQQRLHRRRSKRSYLYREGAFSDDGELDKLENGPDMTFAKVQGDVNTAMIPLQDAPLDSAIFGDLNVSKDDLNIISGTSSEQRGQADRTTATQANLIDQRSQLRETRSRVQVAKVLKAIARLVIFTVQKNFTGSFWTRLKTNRTDEEFLAELQESKEEWAEFTSKDIGETDDFSVDITLDSISPIENDQQKKSFIDFLTILTQFPMVSFDPVLVREAAYRCNYRNEKAIKRMAQMAQLAALGQIEQAKAKLAQMGQQMGMQGMPPPGGTGGTGGTGGSPVETRAAQMQSPDLNQLQTQLQSQSGGLPQ